MVGVADTKTVAAPRAITDKILTSIMQEVRKNVSVECARWSAKARQMSEAHKQEGANDVAKLTSKKEKLCRSFHLPLVTATDLAADYQLTLLL